MTTDLTTRWVLSRHRRSECSPLHTHHHTHSYTNLTHTFGTTSQRLVVVLAHCRAKGRNMSTWKLISGKKIWSNVFVFLLSSFSQLPHVVPRPNLCTFLPTLNFMIFVLLFWTRRLFPFVIHRSSPPATSRQKRGKTLTRFDGQTGSTAETEFPRPLIVHTVTRTVTNTAGGSVGPQNPFGTRHFAKKKGGKKKN